MSAPRLFGAPVVALRGAADPAVPLVVLLHGRGSHEQEIIALADHGISGQTLAEPGDWLAGLAPLPGPLAGATA